MLGEIFAKIVYHLWFSSYFTFYNLRFIGLRLGWLQCMLPDVDFTFALSKLDQII